MKRSIAVFIRILGFTVLLLSQAQAEFPWIYPPVGDIDPDGEIVKNIERERYQSALELLENIARSNPNSSLEARALLDIAGITGIYLRDTAAARNVYQQVIDQYAGSYYEVVARTERLRLEGNREEYDAGVAEILAEFGAPSMAEIESGENLEAHVRTMESLPPEIALALSSFYDARGHRLLYRDISPEGALNIALFGRQAFDILLPSRATPPLYTLYTEVLAKEIDFPRRDIGAKLVEPRITPLSPMPDAIVGQEVNIIIELTAGDFRDTPVDLQSVEVQLDGVDITFDLSVSSALQDRLVEGEVFERITLSLQRELPVGQHTISVFASSMSDLNRETAKASETWTFEVSDNPPPSELMLYPSKDSILAEREPHRNEGANFLLTLEKIEGKSARTVVAFDLDGVNLNGLSKATLIFTIAPNQGVDGWGYGGTVSAYPLAEIWEEGNGQSFGLQKKYHSSGNGSGTTWFSPIDENIGNGSPDSVRAWNGGATLNGTSPSITVQNHSSGRVEFDVTMDVLNGAGQGWLVKRDRENEGSKVSFFSKEGAVATGNLEFSPKLFLEFNSQVAHTPKAQWSVFSGIGLEFLFTELRATEGKSELPSMKELLQQSPVVALAVEQVLFETVRSHPAMNLTSRIAYRSWLADSMQIASVVFWPA
jgi:hypothetical protein